MCLRVVVCVLCLRPIILCYSFGKIQPDTGLAEKRTPLAEAPGCSLLKGRLQRKPMSSQRPSRCPRDKSKSSASLPNVPSKTHVLRQGRQMPSDRYNRVRAFPYLRQKKQAKKKAQINQIGRKIKKIGCNNFCSRFDWRFAPDLIVQPCVGRSFEFSLSDQYEALQTFSILNNLSVHCFEQFLVRTKPKTV